VTVFADSGQRLERLSQADALEAAARFAPQDAGALRYDAYLTEPDQWSLESRALFPLHRIALGDPADSYLYIGDRVGDAVLKTTRSERRWAYAGAVIHWIYVTPFRRHASLWAQTIIWLSLAGCVMCILGLVWGIWRFSIRGRYRLKRRRQRSPYAAWMRWHHYAGLIFGLTTLTWVFSGLLSMDPWAWHPGNEPTSAQREAVAGGPLQLGVVTVDAIKAAVAALPQPPTNVDIVQFRGRPMLASSSGVVALDRTGEPAAPFLPHAAVLAAARAAMPGTEIESETWLQSYDSYYYSRDNQRSLPVLRVKFRDDARTWLYLDPRQGAIVQRLERRSRVNRWLYHGLHSFDFPWLYYRRPLWDVVVIALCLGGVVSSATTLVPGFRRLRRHWRRLSPASTAGR
jgi:hypothetical protein